MRPKWPCLYEKYCPRVFLHSSIKAMGRHSYSATATGQPHGTKERQKIWKQGTNQKRPHTQAKPKTLRRNVVLDTTLQQFKSN